MRRERIPRGVETGGRLPELKEAWTSCRIAQQEGEAHKDPFKLSQVLVYAKIKGELLKGFKEGNKSSCLDFGK